MKTQAYKLGRVLCAILRHRPEQIGLTLNSSGWVPVKGLLDALCIHKSYLKATKDLLDETVRDNSKKRFEYSPDGLLIRACQGHSIGIDLALEPIEPPEFLYHGTSQKYYSEIFRSEGYAGLKKMNRDHVHLSDNKETAFEVGLRHAKDPNLVMLLKVYAKDMYEDGYKFYRSANGVWLINHVPVKYLEWDIDP